MKLSRDWLGDYIDLDGLSDDEIGQRLTEIGHAIEATERHGDDTVFDVEFTTNRIDAMSHRGLARELAVALNRPLREQTRPMPARLQASDVSIAIEAPDLCSRYSALVIRGITVRPSSPAVQRRLEAVGLRPINNIVDATNYVMMALGHPLHAFDLARLAGNRIVVRRGKENEVVKTLDGVDRKVGPRMVVISDGEKPVGLGGVMGGANSEIEAATKDVLLECAHFNPSAIRRTARTLGLFSDAAYRFERGADPNDTVEAIETAAALILAEAGGESEPVIDVVAEVVSPRTIELRAPSLRVASAGLIDLAFAREVFEKLGMRVHEAGSEAISVVVPTYRGDIHAEIDLIEEVLRFFGLNRIPSLLPRVTVGDAEFDRVVETEDRLRDLLVGCGITETVSYAFTHAKWNGLFSTEKPLTITNALNENIASMRLSLLPGLLQSVAHNWSYGVRDGALFEMGRTFHATGARPDERSRASFVMFGNAVGHWGEAKRAVDYFDAKGAVDAIARHFHVELRYEASEVVWAKKGQAATVHSAKGVVATIGAFSRELLRELEIGGGVPVVGAEIDIAALVESVEKWEMKPVSRYPGVPMVLPLLHARELSYQEILDKVSSLDLPYLEDVGIWDRFSGPKGTGEEIKTALGLWYQASDRSLTQEEVLEIHARLVARITDLLPVKVMN